MPDLNCPSDNELQLFANLELNEKGARRIALHLDLCKQCRLKIQMKDEDPGLDETIGTNQNRSTKDRTGPGDELTSEGTRSGFHTSDNESLLTKMYSSQSEAPRISLRSEDQEEESSSFVLNPNDAVTSDSGSRYELRGEIARGGMGAIFKGRDNDLGRSIAIKVLLDRHKQKPSVLRRFIEEAQIGGQLQHPGIAPVYELGQLEDKRPFFSMKLVKGQTLKALLKKRKDPKEGRGKFLGIFEQMCQTVAYAHNRGVIHRDLKPDNIMVGAFGEVQVMDWGLAKVLTDSGSNNANIDAEELAEQSIIQTERSGSDTHCGESGAMETLMGTVMGTPGFMPPEQALGRIDLVDERADIFGLGAILCQILTGHPPYRGEDATSILKLAQAGSLTQCWKQLEASQADHELIQIAKDCLEPNLEDRARHASEVAARVTKFVESVEAKLQASELKRAAETARAQEERKRRRIILSLAFSVLLLITISAGGWLYLEQRNSQRQAEHAREVESINRFLTLKNLAEKKAREEAEAARQVADVARREAEMVSNFMVGLFEDADPIARTERAFGAQQRGQGELTAVEVVNRGRTKLKTELLQQPRLRAKLLDSIGNVYLGLDQTSAAESLLKEAEQIRLREFGINSLEYAQTMESLGVLYMNRNEARKSADALMKALAIRRALPEVSPLLVSNTLFHLGTQELLSYEFDKAEQSLLECLQIRRDHHQVDGKQSDHMDIAAAQIMLAQVYIGKKELVRGMALLQQAAVTFDRLQGSNDFSEVLSLFTQAQILAKLGNKEPARRCFLKMEEKAVKLLGESHTIVAFGRFIFAQFLAENNELENAIVKFRQVIEGYKSSMGPDTAAVAGQLIHLTRVQRRLGDRKAAEISIRESVRIFRTFKPTHSFAINHATSLHIYGAVTDDLGNRSEAEKLLLEAFQVTERNDLLDTSRAISIARDYACMLLNYPTDEAEFRRYSNQAVTPELGVKWATHWAKAAQAQKARKPELNSFEQSVLDFFMKTSAVRLNVAVADGFRDVDRINRIPAFEVLRDRDDFQAFMKTLKSANSEASHGQINDPLK